MAGQKRSKARVDPRASPQASTPASSRAWLIAVIIVVVGVACYANALGNPFVFDDLEAIVANPNITSLTPMSRALSSPPQSAIAGRPLVALSLAVNYAVGGLDPRVYHAWNLVVHLLCALLLAACIHWTLTRLPLAPARRSGGLASLSGMATPISVAAAVVWLVHPLNTELIDYVAQRSESMMALCYLGALYASLRVMSGGGRGWLFAAVVSSAAGMACKEAMVTAPLMILVFDAVFVAGSPRAAIRERPWLYTGLASTWLLLAWLNVSGPRWRSAGFSTGVSPWTYLLHQAEMIVTYLKLTVWPHPLVLDYGLTEAVTLGHALPYLIGVAALFIGSVVLLWRVPAVGFLAAWFFITLSPASSIVPILTEVGAERRMYLPLAGLVTLAVIGAGWLSARATAPGLQRRIAAAIAVTAIAGALAVVTVRRNADYADPVELWRGVVEQRPHGRAVYTLGIVLKKSGRRQEAIEQFRVAAALQYPAAHYALGFDAFERNDRLEAIREFEQFLASAPDDPEVPNVYLLQGQMLRELGRFNESVDAFRTALRMRPNRPEARGGLADALLAANRFADAVPAFESYLQVAPSNATAWGNLGTALIGLDRTADAATAFARAVQLAPTDISQRLNLGYAFSTLGRWDEAVGAFQAILRQSPNHAPALGALGVAYAAQGQREQAIAVFTRAIQIDPGNAQLRADAAAALAPRGR